MTDSYAPAKAAYRELRSTIGPWAKANDYRRWAGTQAGWQKPIDAEQQLLFKFEGYSLVNPDTGNSYHGLVQLEPLGSHGSRILRQSDFSCCLVQAELDQLARIQGAINRRRPPLPWYLKKDVAADSLLGQDLQALSTRRLSIGKGTPSRLTIRHLTCGPSGLPLWGNQAAVDEEVAQQRHQN